MDITVDDLGSGRAALRLTGPARSGHGTRVAQLRGRHRRGRLGERRRRPVGHHVGRFVRARSVDRRLKRANQAGGDLRIAAPTDQVRMALELTNLIRVLHPYKTFDEALQGL